MQVEATRKIAIHKLHHICFQFKESDGYYARYHKSQQSGNLQNDDGNIYSSLVATRDL